MLLQQHQLDKKKNRKAALFLYFYYLELCSFLCQVHIARIIYFIFNYLNISSFLLRFFFFILNDLMSPKVSSKSVSGGLERAIFLLWCGTLDNPAAWWVKSHAGNGFLINCWLRFVKLYISWQPRSVIVLLKLWLSKEAAGRFQAQDSSRPPLLLGWQLALSCISI